MLYRLEIVMPPTDDIPGAVEAVMAPFSEDNGHAHPFWESGTSHPFWDYWGIGGSWKGYKTTLLSELGTPSKGQWGEDTITVGEVPDCLTAHHVIVALDTVLGFGAQFMLRRQEWNGVTWQKSEWDGRIHSALEAYRNHFSSSDLPVGDDWLVVTVEYHS